MQVDPMCVTSGSMQKPLLIFPLGVAALNSKAALMGLIGDFNGYSPTNHRHITMFNLDCLLDGL